MAQPVEWKWPRVRAGRVLAEDPVWLADARKYARLTREDFIRHVEGLDDADRARAFRLRFRFDTEWFLRFCWPDDYSMPFNAFQQWYLSRPHRYWQDRARISEANELWATAAPRGNAKTTLSQGLMARACAYGLEGLIVVLSLDLKKGADPVLKTTLSMMQTSEMFQWIYGGVEVVREQDVVVVTVANNPPIGMATRSFKTQFRGIRFRNQRPTYVLIDDGEHPTRVKSASNRKADYDYLTADVLKAGPPTGGLRVDWVGTVLDRNAILPTLLREPGWRGRLWKAIPTWSTDERSLELWDQCREVWADLTNPDREADAKAFYEEHREAMDRGWEVMDPVTWPLFRLHLMLWSEGLQSFMRERQNEAMLSEYAYFDTDRFRSYELIGEPGKHARVAINTPSRGRVETPVGALRKMVYLDPVPGTDLGSMAEGAGAGDYACIAVLGKDKHGYVYVLDVWLKRARDSEQVSKMWELCEQWDVRNAAVESNGFSRLITRDFRRLQRERMEAGLFYEVNTLEDKVSDNKQERIAAIQPAATEQGWLRFPAGFVETVAGLQFADFPNGSHDDAPDAIASGYRLLGGAATPARRSSTTFRA